MDPMGTQRRPPKAVLEQLHLLNTTHRLGHLLCRSRKPDLLLDIIQNQGTTQSMPWLSDLVQSSDGDFNHLPVQCLCEFLLSNSTNISAENSRDIELITFLQKMLHSDETSDYQMSYEVLEYFLRRLSATSKFGRQSAIQAFKALLVSYKPVNEDEIEAESDWLLKFMPMLPSFPYICERIIAQLRSACQVENSPDLIMTYIQFIATNTLNDQVTEMLDHVTCWSLLIVERSAVFASILPKNLDDPKYDEKFQTLNYLFIMFNNFIIKMKENDSELTLPEYPDLLVVHFADGSQCHMHLNFIHALIILLSESKELNGAMELLSYLFPADNPSYPQAFSVDTVEKVQILPDWLKLKMIRSSIDRMVDVALNDLTPEQLILFIQSFGTPKDSMSKLLALLDTSVVRDTEKINDAIMNRAYLAQFIEIQQLRGAKNGHIAIKFLKSGEKSDDPPIESKVVQKIDMLEVYDPTQAKSKTSSSFRPGKFSSSYRVSSLLGDVLKETRPEVSSEPSKLLAGFKLSESGRNIHHIMSQLIHSTHSFDIENFAHQNLNLKNLKQSKLAALIDCMAVMLKEDSDKLSVNKSGIIVDWLVEFDSELIKTNQDVQVSLLFGKNIQVYRPYFLSLLIHQANWSTIAVAMEKLLNQCNSGIYDPSSVLNFIDAIIRNPKLWQGRDKAVAKHVQTEYVLSLDEDRIKAFIDYILREEEMLIPRQESKMNDRVALLLNCVNEKELSLKMIQAHLETSILEKRVKDKFLQRLYMNIPHMFLSLKSQDEIAGMGITDSVGCTGDKYSHTIITTISSLTNSRDFQSLSQDVELTLRKLAATHPVLLLRELSLIASLLAGRGHMDLRVLRQEHHIAFFNQILGVLELLRPLIFDDAYKNGLHRAINCYFHLLQNHSKDVYGLMNRLMDFLKSYAQANVASAYELVNQNNNLFSELYMRNRSIVALQQLMASTHFYSKSGISVPAPLTAKTDNFVGFCVKLGNLSKMSHEELLTNLQDIDYQTHKRPLQLEEIYGKLTELLFYSSKDIRDLAHRMLLKVLKQNPGNPIINSSCFNAYLQCLQNDDINIAASTLENLTEIVLSLQEYASEILQCVFNLGITSKNNTFVPLKKAMNAIKIQHGS